MFPPVVCLCIVVLTVCVSGRGFSKCIATVTTTAITTVNKYWLRARQAKMIAKAVEKLVKKQAGEKINNIK